MKTPCGLEPKWLPSNCCLFRRPSIPLLSPSFPGVLMMVGPMTLGFMVYEWSGIIGPAAIFLMLSSADDLRLVATEVLGADYTGAIRGPMDRPAPDLCLCGIWKVSVSSGAAAAVITATTHVVLTATPTQKRARLTSLGGLLSPFLLWYWAWLGIRWWDKNGPKF